MEIIEYARSDEDHPVIGLDLVHPEIVVKVVAEVLFSFFRWHDVVPDLDDAREIDVIAGTFPVIDFDEEVEQAAP